MGNLARKHIHRRMTKIGLHMGCRCCNVPGNHRPGFSGRVRTAFQRFTVKEVDTAFDDMDRKMDDDAFEVMVLVDAIAGAAGVCRQNVEVSLNTDHMKPVDLRWYAMISYEDGAYTGIQGGSPAEALRHLQRAVDAGLRGDCSLDALPKA